MDQPTKPRRIRARTTEWAGGPSGSCAQCGAEVEHLEFDHIVPHCEGGRHHLSNIQWLCSPCHLRKSADETRRHRENNPHLYQRPPMSEERRRHLSDLLRGKPHSTEHTEKMREGLKRAWARKSPEERQAIFEKSAAKQRGRKVGPMSEERRQKIGEAQRRAWASGTRRSSPTAPQGT